MTRPNTSPVASPGADAAQPTKDNLYVDRKGVLRARIGARPRASCADTARLDDLARRIPWRQEIAATAAVTFARLAVLRAQDEAARLAARERGRRERAQVARRGLPLEIDPVAALDNRPDHPLAHLGEELGARLGVTRRPGESGADLAARIRAAGNLPAGRSHDVEAAAFVQSLALWWWRNTGRRPNDRPTIGARDPNRQRHRPTSFFEFVTAAWIDVGGDGNIDRIVRTALAAVPTKPWLK